MTNTNAIQPERLEHDSPGQRPGLAERPGPAVPYVAQALKGRNRTRQTESHPFRALARRAAPVPRALPWAIESVPLRGSVKATMVLLLLAALVAWGLSPNAFCAQPVGKAGAAPQPTASAKPSPPAGAKDGKASAALKYESAIPKRELVFDQSENEWTSYYPGSSATPA